MIGAILNIALLVSGQSRDNTWYFWAYRYSAVVKYGSAKYLSLALSYPLLLARLDLYRKLLHFYNNHQLMESLL